MNQKTLKTALSEWGAPALALAALYFALSQRTWSVDGCIMTLNTDHFMDNRSYGHFLLRPVAFVWASLWRALGVRSPEGIYHALRVIFTCFGVGALTLLFNVARRRGGAAAAWSALAVTALARNALRHFATLDEKGIGMLMLAVALYFTARLFAWEESRAGNFDWPGWLGVAGLWVLAVFGHLQNMPYALGFVSAPVIFLGRGMPLPRNLRRCAVLALAMGAAGLILFVALHWNVGRFGSLPLFLHNLFAKNPAPPPGSMLQLWKSAVEGYIKAFFIVDRLSPRWCLAAAVAGFGLIALAAGWGAWAARDAFARLALFGIAFQMLLMPLTNSYPDYGDSYTAMILGVFILLATAPWRLVAAAAAVLAAVNLPAQWDMSNPPLTMKEHLASMEAVQQANQSAPWVVVEELVKQDPKDQEFSPIYYPMDPKLKFTTATLSALPAGPCLVEAPINIEKNGTLALGRLDEIKKDLEAGGRKARLNWMNRPPRVIRSDFKAYGAWFKVE